MGYRAYSKVVYGVQVELRNFPTQVTKYDPDNGQPYKKSVDCWSYALKSTGQRIADSWLDEDGDLVGGEAVGIGISISNHANNGDRILGAILAETEYNEDVKLAMMEGAVRDHVRTFLTTMGIVEQPLLYVQTYHSY